VYYYSLMTLVLWTLA